MLLTGSDARAQCQSTSSCLAVHSPGGCNSPECCLIVCTADPTCCGTSWDSGCVFLANTSCVGYCGAQVSGSCYSPHANPSCDTASCCTAVCQIDPFCCSATWDFTCAQYAGFACPGTPGTCGNSTLSCYTTHAQGACNEPECCTAVCGIDPSCCASSWDQICVYTAEQTCVVGCVPTEEVGAAHEIELCDERFNDPCYAATGGVPQAMALGVQMVGTVGRSPSSANGPDVDVFRVVIPDPDGDGSAKVSMSFAASPLAWAALVPESSACPSVSGSVVQLSSNFCAPSSNTPSCIPAGTYRVVVCAGTYPTFGGSGVGCINSNRYTVKVSAAQTCTPCAPSAMSCFAPRATPGCGDPSCCTPVCSADPFCCNTQWDADCVDAAAVQCLAAPPVNDLCSGAAPISFGQTKVFNLARAGVELPAPTGCGTARLSRDAWFLFDSDVSGLVELNTCGTWFDTVVAVYIGNCKSLVQIGCNDDGVVCIGQGGSRLEFDASCGVRYYLRVASKSLQAGEAELRLVDSKSAACPNCPEDLSGNGTVDAQDIAAMLNGWGTASGDVNGDSTTDAQDIAALLNAWGACP